MQTLLEKAKTTKEIAELWNKYCTEGFTEVPQQIMEQMEAIWVSLEDAQQEIKEKSEGYAKVCARLHEQVIDLTMKGSELKQKLDELLSCFRGWWRVYQHYLPSASTARSDFESHLAKFEELLK